MRIGILGAGTVGVSLAHACIRAGHEVMLSSRTPTSRKMQEILAELNGPADAVSADAGTVAETAAFSDFLALAMGWDAIPAVVDEVGEVEGWTGKTLMDMSNRFGEDPGESAAEDLAARTGANVVKALNTIGAEHYPNPIFGGQAATMFIAGDDTSAKTQTAALLQELGFDVVDAGPLAAAKHLEALAALWVHLAFRAGQGRDVAFKLLRK